MISQQIVEAAATPYTNAHSYSSLQLLLRCERAWTYRYREGYRPIVRDNANTLRGSAWHAMCQAYWLAKGADYGTLLERPSKLDVIDGLQLGLDWEAYEWEDGSTRHRVIADLPGGRRVYLTPAVVCQAVAEWWIHAPGELRSMLQFEIGMPLAERLWGLWNRYVKRWEDDNARYHPLLTEATWSRRTPGDRALTGRVDAVLYDTVRRLTVVVDFKSHGAWPQYSEATADLMNSQLHLGAWGMAPGLPADRQPAAVMYDRALWLMCGNTRSALPAPKWTAGTAKSSSRLAATPTNFDETTYREGCVAAGHEVDEELVAKNRDGLGKFSFGPDDWFRRHLKPASAKLIDQHIRSAEHAAARTDTITIDTASISPSENCERCEFLALCQTEMVSGRPEPLVLADYGLRKSGPR